MKLNKLFEFETSITGPSGISANIDQTGKLLDTGIKYNPGIIPKTDISFQARGYHKEKIEDKYKVCLNCGEEFDSEDDSTRNKYCSYECEVENKRFREREAEMDKRFDQER